MSAAPPASDRSVGRMVLPGGAEGPIVTCDEALSFWGGVDPASGRVIDAHHPLHGVALAGTILLLPTSRGSCSGSGVLLDLVLTGRAPAALVFREAEDVLTLGALVAATLFGKTLPVLRVPAETFARLGRAVSARVTAEAIEAEGIRLPLSPGAAMPLALTPVDEAMIAGERGEAVRLAMAIVCAMARQQGAERLVDVSRVHVDGCIYASPANLLFAERMAALGAKVVVPTTTNAISVDRDGWRAQGVDPAFGTPAARLADAYVGMGCRPTFTCAPYLLDAPPRAGEIVAWAESNAAIFANSVLGARTAKHPDFLDLCIALTGRAPLGGVYRDAERRARRVVEVDWPAGAGAAVWPLIGYVAGRVSPDRIPLVRGIAAGAPSHDDLKALCAAFGTTSGAPMLHIAGVTPEAGADPAPDADRVAITRRDLAEAWASLNAGPERIDLVAFGSPHASLDECRAIAAAFGDRRRRDEVPVIVTAGREVIAAARREGLLAQLTRSGVAVVPDLCWCSISEPVFPPQAKTVMTTSGKYAHYGPGLSGRSVRLGSLADCVEAALQGRVPVGRPDWLA